MFNFPSAMIAFSSIGLYSPAVAMAVGMQAMPQLALGLTELYLNCMFPYLVPSKK